MGKIIFITGGARSGKSTHAEEMAKKYKDVAYVATGIITDEEMKLRVLRHQAQRPSEWKTYEEPYDIAKVLLENYHEAYLIDCITVYITNLLLKEKTDWDTDTLTREEQEKIETLVETKIEELIDAMKNSEGTCIVVSNEVGMGLVPAFSLGRLFRDIVGRTNRMLAAEAEQAYLSISGILIPLKGLQGEI